MRISLIDIDSKIPNLALMKISAYHKQKGDIVGLDIDDPDLAYISCIFSKNKPEAIGISKMFFCPVSIGGYGVNDLKLSDEIEHIMPDYSLYNCGYSMGFTTRGCIRNCSFCIVPQKEGKIRPNADIYEFWNRDHKHIVLLDNNILALPKHFEKISNQIIENNLTVDFNQGLDIRLINDKNAEILSKLKISPCLRVAFDSINIESDFRKGIEILKSHECCRALVYVLVGFDSSQEDDIRRLDIIKELNQRPYVMRHDNCRGIRWYNDLSAWTNQQRFFMKYSFDYFCKLRHSRSKKGRKLYDDERPERILCH